MLVQALAAYTDRYLADQLNDAHGRSKPVPWQIESPLRACFGALLRT